MSTAFDLKDLDSDIRALKHEPVDVAQFSRPVDWPAPGAIDLDVHDLPHASSTTEWWYQNTHLVAEDGKHYSLFCAFFRQMKGWDPETKEKLYAHSITWAITDVDAKKYVHHSGIDQSAPEEGLKRITRGLGAKDQRLNRALAEVLERGNVPSPDQLFKERVFVNLHRLELDYAGDTWRKQDDGTYRLHLWDEERKAGCELAFDPLKPPTRHGDDGVVLGADSEVMFYYFIPRCQVTGRVTFNGVESPIKVGSGWIDHEFGVGDTSILEDELRDSQRTEEELNEVHAERRAQKEASAVGWDWLSCQLDDGTDVTVYPLKHLLSNESAGDHCVVIDPRGRRSVHHDITFEAIEWWQSTQTFFEYPVRWRVHIPSAGLELDVKASFPDQEFITLISKPSFWEGRVQVEGTRRGAEVSGPGYIERSGFTPFEDLDGYFKAVGKVIRASIAKALPLEPDYETARDLIASEERDHYMDGLDLEQLGRTLIAPIREMTDRGGKGWRSYAAITCCDIVGGDSRNFVQWLCMPEMMHVGSLIVDDVQDKSTIRRGGPCAHLMYGEAQAINSGTAAYFATQKMLVNSPHLSDASRLRIYDLYFEAMRAGHAGQAIDLDGFDGMMDHVVASGDAAELEKRILCVHLLKTAAPAGALSRMGAIAGDGTDQQVEALGNFFEKLGLSFQIIDDVLNLRGFKGDLKSKGEDIQQGKITLPVAKAFGRMCLDDRRWVHETLRTKPEDPEVVQAVIDKLEECGAIEACLQEAKDMVEQAWQQLEPTVEDTLAKLMLRAFSWFILERHY